MICLFLNSLLLQMDVVPIHVKMVESVLVQSIVTNVNVLVVLLGKTVRVSFQ